MTFITTALAVYTGVMLSSASLAGFVIILRNMQVKKVKKGYALLSKPKEGAKR